MFKINDAVFYENYGICQITDIQTLSCFGQEPKLYYYLKPLYDTCSSTLIKTPIDTKNVIRLAMTEDQAKSFILNLPKLETVWPERIKERETLFSAMIDSWDIEAWAKVIRSGYLNKATSKSRNNIRPFPLTDQKYIVKAEYYLNQELAYALRIEEYAIPEYIRSLLENHADKNSIIK